MNVSRNNGLDRKKKEKECSQTKTAEIRVARFLDGDEVAVHAKCSMYARKSRE